MEAIAGASAMASELFDYNKENYFYDRRMRQRQELKIMSYRNRQALLWRQDVRDLIELTIGKMDAYTVVNALQLSMSIEIITAGRIAPGTPQWLMWQYLLSLAGAFAYLFMAVWLAMHASVSAHAGRTRLLTQFVRLPIPSWEQLEASRTYASSVEGQGVANLLRVPFIMSPMCSPTLPPAGPQADQQGDGSSGEPNVQETPDPWGLERAGLEIYELQQIPVGALRHVDLVRRAGVDWQAYDAFTRVTMTMGSTHLLYALYYWLLANILVQNGEIWGPCFICVLFSSAAYMLFNLDVSLSSREAQLVMFMLSAGPVCGCLATIGWCTYCHSGEMVAWAVLPISFGSHSWLLHYILRIVDIKEQPNGTLLPTRWRAVLYLDVFGWLFTNSAKKSGGLGAAIQLGGKAVKRGLQAFSSKLGAHSGGYLPVSQQEDLDSLGPLVPPQASAKAQASTPPSPQSKPGKPVPLKHGQIESMSTICSGRTLKTKDADTQDRGASSSACAANTVPSAAAGAGLGVSGTPSPLELELELWRDFAFWQAPAVQAALSEGDRDLLTRLEIEFSELLTQQQRTVKPSELPEPFGDLKLDPPKWLLLKGHCDIGTEIDYLHDLQTGEVKYGRESEDALGRTDVTPLSLPATEQRLAQYHDAVRHDLHAVSSSSASNALPHAARGGQAAAGGRKLGLKAQLPIAGVRLPTAGTGRARQPRSMHPAARAAAFPDQRANSCPPLRPENACWGREPGWDEQHYLADSRSGDQSIGVLGVGAAGAVPTSSHHTFKPDSYYPHSSSAWEATDINAVVTGHDQLQGRAPWLFFQCITRLLSVLWFMGVLWCLGRLMHAPDVEAKPLTVVEESIFAENDFDDGPSFLQELITSTVKGLFGMGNEDDLPRKLGSGEEILVKWPHTSKFEPRKLSCDASGQHFVVADDFGVWFARLEATAELVSGHPLIAPSLGGADRPPSSTDSSSGASPSAAPGRPADGNAGGGTGSSPSMMEKTTAAVEAAARQALRSITGLGQDGQQKPSGAQGERQQQQQQQQQEHHGPAPHPQYSVILHATFGRLPLCSSLEGQKPQDVSVICAGGGTGDATDFGSSCSAVVLYGEEGAFLTACPLRSGSGTGEQTWTISQDWLDDVAGEHLKLLAVDASCTSGADSNASSVFMPGLGTCTVVSTSLGRLVQLRQHMRRSTELVPSWATVPSMPAPGSIQVFDDRAVLALVPPGKAADGASRGYRTYTPPFMLRAISKETGSTLGEWLLPRGHNKKPREWTGVTTGGGSLFLLEAEETGSKLWRFPLPETLLRIMDMDRRAPTREPVPSIPARGSEAAGFGQGGRAASAGGDASGRDEDAPVNVV